MDREKEIRITRRQFTKAVAVGVMSSGGLAANLVAPPAAAEETGKLITDIEGNASMVNALGYVGESPKADQRCGNCQLFVGADEGVGKCQLFQQGGVPAKAWCKSWVAKIPS